MDTKLQPITQKFEAFIAEANRLADAFSTVGQDDNSYDAGGLANDAKEILFDLQAKRETIPRAMKWLEEAQKKLDRL